MHLLNLNRLHAVKQSTAYAGTPGKHDNERKQKSHLSIPCNALHFAMARALRSTDFQTIFADRLLARNQREPRIDVVFKIRFGTEREPQLVRIRIELTQTCSKSSFASYQFHRRAEVLDVFFWGQPIAQFNADRVLGIRSLELLLDREDEELFDRCGILVVLRVDPRIGKELLGLVERWGDESLLVAKHTRTKLTMPEYPRKSGCVERAAVELRLHLHLLPLERK